jgi:hypothetical protein
VSSLAAEITTLFRHSWLGCAEAGFIGREMVAIDGVQLPSHARTAWSGTKTDLKPKAQPRQAAVEPLVSAHGANDARDAKGSSGEAAERQLKTLNAARENIADCLATPADTLGKSGPPKHSHSTANESATMPTRNGVIQGSDGMVVADSTRQVIVHAEAFGEGQEHGRLLPLLEGGRETCRERELSEDIRQEPKLTAAAG